MKVFLYLVLVQNLYLRQKFFSSQILLGCFWICGFLTWFLNEFASEALLSSCGISEFAIIIGSFLSDSEREKETENRRVLLEGTAVLVVLWGFL